MSKNDTFDLFDGMDLKAVIDREYPSQRVEDNPHRKDVREYTRAGNGIKVQDLRRYYV